MGVLNVTPDSFSDGGLYCDVDSAVAHGHRLVAGGADIVDVGGESTRPGAEAVPVDIELDRVVPVVEALSGAGLVVSIDTTKPRVADAAVAAGAEIINDVSGMGDHGMRRLAARTGVGVVVMHMKGTPRTMQDDPRYDDIVGEVAAHLGMRAEACVEAGVARESICVDPGIGFGKTLAHNLELLNHLDVLAGLGFPVLVGVSRKRFIGTLLDLSDPLDRDHASSVVGALAIARGANIIRVHEPGISSEAARLAWAIVRSRSTTQNS
jgi:dihydropteroate synthase